MARPIIAVVTDFGTADHYAGAIKGVMLRVCRDATIVDITHEIPPQDILAGALVIEACCRDFPPATVFIGFVDPGVGTERRAIAAEADGYRFVGPDNGLFALAWRRMTIRRLVAIETRGRPATSRTFEGRDRFAPAAAWLAAGGDLDELGPAVDDYVRLVLPAAQTDASGIVGEVIAVDRFGNLVTNIDRPLVEDRSWGGTLSVTVGGRTISGLSDTYALAGRGALCALFGSTDRLEVAVSGGSAAHALACGRGARVQVSSERLTPGTPTRGER